MASIESVVIRVVADVSGQLAPRLANVTDRRPAAFPTLPAMELMQDLGLEAQALLDYLDSPDFAVVAAQLRIRQNLGQPAKDQLQEGLRLAGVPERHLPSATDVVYRALVAACDEVGPLFGRHSGKIDQHDVIIAATQNSRMLAQLKSLTEIHNFAARMRSQVVALHNKIRLPHIGVSRAVEYKQLYVEPALDSYAESGFLLGATGDRIVVVGDPGAGKSTLASKFAYDIALGDTGRVPFFLVLREFTGSFDEGGHDLAHYLEMVCRAPYNVVPPQDAVEYLLRTGRAVVVLDGLDEIVQTELRRRVVALVEGFAHLYPLVPILVTARAIGYSDAPLDRDLFVDADILEFNLERVQEYVRRWFALDDATSPAERARLAASFMDDSEQIPELRGNPLLLTLLCAMYSSDRYLPRNLAQVYERCALMLFEQWDSRRGIPLPLKFHGRLRGAVQHLAWQMFTAPESGKAQPRTRIISMLASYLDKKLDDHDESVRTAEEFLAFCTGRAWILTDVGATETEPQFGFTHRTFLEYFAAEHLVRTNRTANDLWAALRPNINQWEVVAQIVLQLYDRNVEGGVDELLAEALSGDGVKFAARALHHVHPSNRTVRAIVEAALNRSVYFEVGDRTHKYTPDIDNALWVCMYECSPANRPIVELAVANHLGVLLKAGEVGAAVVLENIVNDAEPEEDARWREIQRELMAEYEAPLAELRKRIPWGGGSALDRPDLLEHIVRTFGARALFAMCSYHGVTCQSAAESIASDGLKGTRFEADRLRLACLLVEQPTPWFSEDDSFIEVYLSDQASDEQIDGLRVLLMLPALELLAASDPGDRLHKVVDMIRKGSLNRVDRDLALAWLDQADFPPTVRDFLKNWVQGEIITVREPVLLPPH